MRKKVEINRTAQDYIMYSVWRGCPIPAAARSAGVKLRDLRRYRKTHKIYDTRLRKLREPYTLFCRVKN